MDVDQASPPAYDNIVFQHEGTIAPPPGRRVLYPNHVQVPPSDAAAAAPRTINTHWSTAHLAAPAKGKADRRWRRALCGSLSALLASAVIGLFIWYFLFHRCALGRSCRPGGRCVRPSQWCDGTRDCPDGEDEAHCLRLHGTEFLLQSYSPEHQAWVPVCVEHFNHDYGRAACVQLGYRSEDYMSYVETRADLIASKGYLKLNHPVSDQNPHIHVHLSYSRECSANTIQLRCSACGRSSSPPSTRIVGGTVAVNGAWPWQVSLQIQEQHVCGGSVIDRSWILSAAHCFHTYSNPRLWRVQAGNVSLREMRSTTGIGVQKVISHEGFDPVTNDNDVALLKLQTPLTFSDKVSPVCLPNAGVDLSPPHQAWITGWGALRSEGPSPDKLNQAQVTIYSQEVCNRPGVLDGSVSESMFCAGKLRGGVDTCQGDSGGPLVVNSGSVWWLAGDTSWGIGCALKNKPGVYGNISYLMDWIHERLQNE